MSTAIYYFSGSGNSLVVARDLAARLAGQLIAIPSVVNHERIETDAEVVGIVFPVYYASLGGSGIPLIVERFIGRLENLHSKYLFAVCTHRGAPCSTIENLGRLIGKRGGQLAAGYAVKMSNPYPAAGKLRRFLFHTELETEARRDEAGQQQLIRDWRKKLAAICQWTKARKRGLYETRSRVASIVLTPYDALQNRMGVARYQRLAGSARHSFDELVPCADRGFDCDSTCNGCGICARVCPVGNIKMVGRRPVWQHRCETCFACFQWCPKGAIGGDIVEYEQRYRHPDVKLRDMLSQNGTNGEAP